MITSLEYASIVISTLILNTTILMIVVKFGWFKDANCVEEVA